MSSDIPCGTTADETQEYDEFLTLSDFKLWSSKALKSFLSLRNKSVTGSIEVLAARAFGAYEEGTPVDKEREHLERTLLEEYKSKLIINDETIPDPLKLKSGWLKEEAGITKWPPLYLSDISRYFREVLDKRDLVQRIECEYKQGKAYRYFSNNFIGEVQINLLGEKSQYCLFRTKCLPSMRVTMKQYEIWAIVRKTVRDELGGEILNSYCTCTAGLLGSCNHVAGLLFRIEAANLVGMCNPTCTSTLSSWNVPGSKKDIIPGKVSDFIFTQEKYLKKSTQGSKEERKQNVKRKQLFQVMSDSQAQKLSKAEQVRKEFYDDIKEVIPNSCFTELIEAKAKRRKADNIQEIPSIIDFGKSFIDSCPSDLDVDDLADVFLESLHYSEEQINALQLRTTSQSSSNEWIKQRHGRLTASGFKQYVYKSKKLQSNPGDECPAYVISNVMGYSKNVQTWQMKHGINTEIHAKEKYKLLTRKMHRSCTIRDVGITILSSHPFISATPDLKIDCDCHGQGLVEIKCPASLIGKIPSCDNYDHLEEVNGEVRLKSSSPYYYQVQGQMGVTNRKYCDFFVFTFQGHVTVRVHFDEVFWNDTLENLIWFWRHYIAPEILSSKLKNKLLI